MARQCVRLGRRRLVVDTTWYWWQWRPAEMWCGLNVGTYQTASGGTGVTIQIALVPTVQLRILVVVYA